MSYDEESPDEYEVVDEEILAGEISSDQNEILTKDRKVISQGQGTFRRINIRSRFLASCGHLIHSLDEVGGRCQHRNCSALVCRDCLRVCKRCLKLVCPNHSKLHDGDVYCPTCKWIVLFGLWRSERNSNDTLAQQQKNRGILYYLFQYPIHEKWRGGRLYDYEHGR